MSFKFVAVSVLSTLTLAACGSSGSNGTPFSNGADKAEAKAQMAGSWFKDCTTKNVAWDLVGVGSQRVKVLFGNDGQETIQLYSDAACNKQVGSVVYTIKTDVGAKNAAEGSSWIDMNYTKAELTITDQTVLDKVNASPVAACGIKTWEIGKSQDISTALGSTESQLTCPFMKTGDVYDIVKSDGQTMHFGKSEAGHDKSTREARPIALDNDAAATFHKE